MFPSQLHVAVPAAGSLCTCLGLVLRLVSLLVLRLVNFAHLAWPHRDCMPAAKAWPCHVSYAGFLCEFKPRPTLPCVSCKFLVCMCLCVSLQVMQQRPTGVVAASKDAALAREVQELFASPCMRVNTSTDVTGGAGATDSTVPCSCTASIRFILTPSRCRLERYV